MSDNSTSVGRERRLYYSSTQGPFHNASSIHLFYGGAERGAIVEEITRSLRTEDHLRIVRGERGSGKTMLSLVLCDRIRHRFNIIRYDHQFLSRSLILRHLLIELCPQDADLISSGQASRGADAQSLERAEHRLTSVLLAAPPANKPFAFVVDSPMETDPATLALLHRLCAIRRDGRAAMQIVSFQRSEAGNRRPAVPASAAAGSTSGLSAAGIVDPEFPGERHYWLRRLTLAEINEYVGHHMLLYDFTRRDMFTREMVYFIADRSEGVFRAINTLARNAFTIAGLENADQLSMSHLLMAGLPARRDEIPVSFLSRHRRAVIALCGSCVVVSIGVMVLLL